MRKHHGAGAALVVRALTAWTYAVRAAIAILVSGWSPGWLWLHARKALRPRGPGVREAAAAYNRRLEQASAGGSA